MIFNSNPLVYDIVIGIFGLLVGSFLNVVIYRVPAMMDREEQDWHHDYTTKNVQSRAEVASAGTQSRKEITSAESKPFNLMQPASSCPKCDAPIKPHQNIPILSYLFLRGRCANCGVSIPLRYPAIEALTCIMSMLVAWKFGFSVACAGALILTWTLIALTFIDFDRQWLPDRITLPLMWIGLGFSLLTTEDGGIIFTGPRASIIGAMAGYLSLWTVYKAFKLVTGKEGMGYGDFKLLAALGAWFGWQVLPIIILLSAVVGLIAAVAMIIFRGHNRQVPIPFGPYLAAAGFIVLLWGSELLTIWLGGGIPNGTLQ